MERSYSLGEFARQDAIGLTTVRGEIKAGRLAARKVGRRTIITADDAKIWRNGCRKCSREFAPPTGYGDGHGRTRVLCGATK